MTKSGKNRETIFIKKVGDRVLQSPTKSIRNLTDAYMRTVI